MKTNRRGFIKGLMGAVATVAISARLSNAMPKLDLTEENLERTLQDIGQSMRDALARSIMQTKEHAVAKVYRVKRYGQFEVEMSDGRRFYSKDAITWGQ